MNASIVSRPLRTALAILALAPLAALAQGGPPQNDDRNPHGAAQRGEGRGPGQQQGPQGQGPQSPQRPDNAPGRRNPQPDARDDHAPQGYAFGQQDRTRLQQHYNRSLRKIDRNHRPQFEAGREIPRHYRGYITPAPVSVRRHLPPPPAGYTVGYYQGYTVVYDPTTFVILSVIDLLSP